MSSRSTDQHQPQNNKQGVVAISLITAVCLLGDSMLYIALPVYWQQAGLLSLWEVGIILSINRFVRLPLTPIIGWLYTKIPLRGGLLAAVLLAAASTAGYGIGEGLWVWIALRCVWGFAWSLLRLGGLFSVIAMSGDGNRGQIMGTYNGLYRLGSLFGMLLGGVLAGVFGLKAVAIAFGVLSLAAVPIVLLYVRPGVSSRPVPSQGKVRWRDIPWGSAAIRNVLLGGLLITLVYQGVVASTLSYVIDYHFSDAILLFGVTMTAAALSGYLQSARWVWEPFLASRFGGWSDGPAGRLPVLRLSLIVAAASLALIPMSLPLGAWIVIVLISLLSATSLTTVMDTLASDAAKSTNAVSLMTVYSLAIDLGAALGPVLAYALLDLAGGLQWIYLGGAFVFLLMIAVWRRPGVVPNVVADKGRAL